MIKIDVRHLTPRPTFAFSSGQSAAKAQKENNVQGHHQWQDPELSDSLVKDMKRSETPPLGKQAARIPSQGASIDGMVGKTDQNDQWAEYSEKSPKAPTPDHPVRAAKTFEGLQNNSAATFVSGEQRERETIVQNEHFSGKPTRSANHVNECALPQNNPRRSLAPSLNPLAPKDYEEAKRLANLLCEAKMAPQGFETPQTCLVAILQGMEMGLSPLFALQRMAIVDGRLTIWGDGALALVLRSGLCVSITEWIEGDDESEWIAHCEVLREGWDRPITRSFAVQDAKRANLWHKPGPWTEYPKRMLQMRARAFALRDVFADVLGGLYFREEIEPRASQAKSRDIRSRLRVTPCENEPQSDLTSNNPKPRQKSLVSSNQWSDDEGLEQTRLHPSASLAIDMGSTSQADDQARHFDRQGRSVSMQEVPTEHKQSIAFKNSPAGGSTAFNLNAIQRRKAPAPPNLGYSTSSESQEKPVQGIQSRVSQRDDGQVGGLGEAYRSWKEDLPKAQSMAIMEEFEQDLNRCLTHDALENIRLHHQPHLDLLDACDLDHAGAQYLHHEARIEAEDQDTAHQETNNVKSPTSKRKRRINTPSRRWRTGKTRLSPSVTKNSTAINRKNSTQNEPSQYDE